MPIEGQPIDLTVQRDELEEIARSHVLSGGFVQRAKVIRPRRRSLPDDHVRSYWVSVSLSIWSGLPLLTLDSASSTDVPSWRAANTSFAPTKQDAAKPKANSIHATL